MTDQEIIEERVARLLEAQQDKRKIKELQAEVERLKAAFAPTIELLRVWTEFFLVKGNEHKQAEDELVRLRAIVEKGTE